MIITIISILTTMFLFLSTCITSSQYKSTAMQNLQQTERNLLKL